MWKRIGKAALWAVLFATAWHAGHRHGVQWEREVYEQVEQDMFPMNVRIAAGRAYRCGYDQAESDRARMLTGKGTWVDSWCSELKGP